MAEAEKINTPKRSQGLENMCRALRTIGTVLFIVLVQVAIAVIAVVLLVLGPAIVLA